MPRPLPDRSQPLPSPDRPAALHPRSRSDRAGHLPALASAWRRARSRAALALVLVMAATSGAWAGPFGYLQGLGVNTSTGMNAIDRPASAWTPTAAGVIYQIEDSVGAGGLVGPGIGGQPFDLEALNLQTLRRIFRRRRSICRLSAGTAFLPQTVRNRRSPPPPPH